MMHAFFYFLWQGTTEEVQHDPPCSCGLPPNQDPIAGPKYVPTERICPIEPTMAPKPGKNDERSAASATRFTATTPHASSKRAAPAPPARTPKRQPGPATAAAAAAARPAAATKPTNAESVIPPISPGAAKETPQQRVARLRAAHDAAKQASISPLDRFLEKTRPIFNSAHKITVVGLVGLTGVFLSRLNFAGRSPREE